jgi:hypothetical protein
MAYCKACIEKDLKIAKLEETVKGLQAKLRYRKRKEEEGPFGLSTPSSKKPFKENASEEKTNKKGGAVLGHKGHGRISLAEEAADLVVDRDGGDACPECGTPLVPYKEANRSVIDNAPQAPTPERRRARSSCPRSTPSTKAGARSPLNPSSKASSTKSQKILPPMLSP